MAGDIKPRSKRLDSAIHDLALAAIRACQPFDAFEEAMTFLV